VYVFSINIPLKGSQSLAKIMSKVTAVSYLHSGVNDSAVQVTAVSMTTVNFFQNLHCIDIPFKGSQSLSKMMSKITVESMTPLCR
jgi:hypothetical protein